LGTTIQDVNRKHSIAYSTVERIFYAAAQEKVALHEEYLEKVQDQQDIALSLDEDSVRKGHKYEAVLFDANLSAVMGKG